MRDRVEELHCVLAELEVLIALHAMTANVKSLARGEKAMIHHGNSATGAFRTDVLTSKQLLVPLGRMSFQNEKRMLCTLPSPHFEIINCNILCSPSVTSTILLHHPQFKAFFTHYKKHAFHLGAHNDIERLFLFCLSHG